MCDAPKVLMQAASIIWLISGIIFLVGSLIWFPRFLLPPWYRRAVKAGIPRIDPYAMGAFKAPPAVDIAGSPKQSGDS